LREKHTQLKPPTASSDSLRLSALHFRGRTSVDQGGKVRPGQGSGSFDFRIDVTDNGEPGAGQDTYRIRLSNGYDSGTQTLAGGNIQLH
jgi:hypothetical protein